VCAGVKGPGRVALGTGLYAIESFRAKLQFVDVSLRQRLFDATALAAWDELQKRAAAASLRRNQLAHRSVMIYSGEKVVKQFALVDWKQRSVISDDGRAPSGAMGIRALVECRYLFTPISLELENLAARLDGVAEPWTIDPPLKAPTLEEIVTHERALLRGLGAPL
jgi:hypothetical protein